MEYGKCGPLCQHPACWYVGERIADITQKHPRFEQYVEWLSTKRSTRDRERPRPDTMPALTIIDTSDSASLVTPVHPQRHSPVTLPCARNHNRPRHKSEFVQSWASSRRSDVESATMPYKLCSFAQMVLEELPDTTNEQDYPLADFTYLPVLTWRPGEHRPNQMTAERREWPGLEQEPLRKSGSKRDSRQVELKTLNLSDSISLKAPSEKDHFEEMRKCSRSRRRLRASHGTSDTAALDQYIMEDLHDIPMQAIQQVLQQWHRESVDDDSSSSESSDALCVASRAPITEVYHCQTPTVLCETPSDHSHQHRPSRLPSSFLKTRRGRFVKMTTRTPPSKSREDLVGSFSRALAAQPREALVEMKARTASLQRKAGINRKPYVLAKDRFPANSLHFPTAIFPSANPLQSWDAGQVSCTEKLRLPIHRNPSMALRFYHKVSSERRARLANAPLCSQQTWQRISLPKSPAGPGRWDHHVHLSKPVASSLVSHPKLSVHVPCEYAIDRPFSEERSTGLRPESNLDETHTPITSCHSSGNLTTSNNAVGGTGEVVLFGQDRGITHQVDHADTTTRDIPTIDLTLLPGAQGGGPLVGGDKEQEELLGGDSFLEDGTIAPPPTARDPLSDYTTDSDSDEDTLEIPVHTNRDDNNAKVQPVYTANCTGMTQCTNGTKIPSPAEDLNMTVSPESDAKRTKILIHPKDDAEMPIHTESDAKLSINLGNDAEMPIHGESNAKMLVHPENEVELPIQPENGAEMLIHPENGCQSTQNTALKYQSTQKMP